MHERKPAGVSERITAETAKVIPAFVIVIDRSFGIGSPDDLRHAVGEVVQMLFQLPEMLFAAFLCLVAGLQSAGAFGQLSIAVVYFLARVRQGLLR